jgi:hypothetical protein
LGKIKFFVLFSVCQKIWILRKFHFFQMSNWQIVLYPRITLQKRNELISTKSFFHFARSLENGWVKS